MNGKEEATGYIFARLVDSNCQNRLLEVQDPALDQTAYCAYLFQIPVRDKGPGHTLKVFHVL